MSQIYPCPVPATTVTNAGGNADLWTFLPADDKPIRLRGFRLGQTSELGDAAEEAVEIQIIRMTATVTDGNGTAGTIETLSTSDAAAGFTFEYNGATVATTTGATDILESLAWNLRNSPYEVWYPDERFSATVKQGEVLLIRLISTVTDDITFVGTAWIEEL